MTKKRIIKDIETFDDAIKAEKYVEAGYDQVIEGYLAYWIAVEGDMIDSYTKLAKKSRSETVRSTLNRIIKDSKRHALMLTSMQKSFNTILGDERVHVAMLRKLARKTQS
jgi:hypothetical protein